MSKLHLLTHNDLYTQKAKSLVALFQKKVVVPETVIFQDEKHVELTEDITKTLDSQYFYVRMNFPDNTYPHHLSSCSHKTDISKDLKNFIQEAKTLKKSKYDIIIQPILNFDWSGVALVKDDFILIEIVFGHPISLLRLGEFKFRFLFDKGENLLDVNEGIQKTYMEWQKNTLTKSGEIVRKHGIDQILNVLRKIRKTESVLYEFGYSEPNFYYLEFKELNRNSFASIKNNIVQKPFTVFNRNELGIKFPKMKFLNPVLENLKDVTEKNEVIVESGAFLSHFSTYCAFQNINCLFLS